MTYYPFPENRRTKALTGLLLFLLLYLARDTLVTSSLLGFYATQGCVLGILLASGVGFLWWNRKNLKGVFTDRRWVLLLICGGILLLPMVGKRDWQLMYLSVLLCICTAVFLSFFLRCREAAGYYVVILAVLGAYSILAAYLFRMLPDGNIAAVPVFQNQIGVEFYNFLLSFVPLTYVKTRNFGIFREPGVYQFFLMLGLYLTHYQVQWRKERNLWTVSGILALTMLTTFSTGGIAELGLFYIVVFFDKKLYRKKWVWIALLCLTVAVGVLAAYCIVQQNVLYWEVYDMVIGKFTYQEESLGDRMGSIVVNLEAFHKNPLLGQKLGEVLFAVGNNTSSSLILFAILGIFGGCLHVAGWVALVWKKEQRLWVNLMLLLVLFLSFNTQNLIADVYFWLFPIMALTERCLCRSQGGENV